MAKTEKGHENRVNIHIHF